jgi:hypothetical protein
MRCPPKSGELRNIRRVEYKKKTGKGQTRLWQVHFTFKDRKPISQSFSDNLFSGKEQALIRAQQFRDAMEYELAASETRYGTFGTVDLNPEVGVSRSSSKRKTLTGIREHMYWQAFWPGIEKPAMNKKFYDSKYGGSDAAKQAAVEERRRGFEEYQEHFARIRFPSCQREGRDIALRCSLRSANKSAQRANPAGQNVDGYGQIIEIISSPLLWGDHGPDGLSVVVLIESNHRRRPQASPGDGQKCPAPQKA